MTARLTLVSPPAAAPLFRVRIVMPDGSRGSHCARYPGSCDAVLRALSLFPAARSISVIRLPDLQPSQHQCALGAPA